MNLEVTPKSQVINVNEIFGRTIQGEGPHAGQLVAFLRVAGCNLSCVWCDTPYSWDWERYDRSEESHPMTIEEVATQINAMQVNRIVVTGGEPMLQQRHFKRLQELTNCFIDVETNGTRLPTDEAEAVVDLFCVSPKLAHAGDPEDRRIKPAVLRKFSELSKEGKAFFKFVVEQESDFEEIDKFIEAGEIPREAIWIMPEGYTPERHMENLHKLADSVISRGYNLTSRLHILIWGTKRGH